MQATTNILNRRDAILGPLTDALGEVSDNFKRSKCVHILETVHMYLHYLILKYYNIVLIITLLEVEATCGVLSTEACCAGVLSKQEELGLLLRAVYNYFKDKNDCTALLRILKLFS